MKFLYLLLACLSSSDCLILTSSVEGGEAVCPGEEITLTCTVTEGVSLGWISEPYIPWLHAVTFTSTEWLRVGVPVHRDPFQIVLRNITSNSSQTNLTSILSFIATSTLNGTVVECDSDRMTARITFHIAGPPPPPCCPTYHTQQRGCGNVTVSAQWEYPKWMVVDNFTVTVPSVWSAMSISGSTKSVTLTLNYNEVYTIEIVATKCGNNSNPAVLRVVEVGCGLPSLFPNGTVICQNTTEGSLAYYQCGGGFNNTAVCGADGQWSPTPVCREFESGDDVVLQSQPTWTIAVVVVFIILASVCATFLIAIFTLMFWRKHKLRVTKKSQGIPEQPGPVYAEVQPGTGDVHLEMKNNVAYSPIKLPVSGKFEMGDNVAYGCRSVGH